LSKIKSQKHFYQMIFSYVLVVLMITAIIVPVAVNYSRQVINSEIRKFDQRILHSASEQIYNDIIITGHSIFLEIALMRGWAASPSVIREMMADKVAIVEFYTYLQNMVLKHSGLDIHVFFHTENAMISSIFGYKEFETRDFAGDFAWLETALSGNHLNYFSIPLSNIEGSPHQNIINISVNFPMGLPLERALSTIIITFDEELIYQTFSSHFATGYNSVYLVDASGVVLSSLDRQIVFTPASYYIEGRINRGNIYGYHQFRQDGNSYILSHHIVGNTDWYIVNIISLRDFYQSFFILRFNIIAISLIVVLAGIYIAVFFSRLFYKPVRRLSRKAAEVFGTEMRDEHDEYNVIEGVLDQMNLRITDLQNILASNAAVMKQNFLIYLLNGSFRSDQEIENRLALFSLHTSYSRIVCFVLELSNEELDSMPLDKRQASKIGIVDILNASGDGWYSIAGEYSDKKAVGALVFSDASAKEAKEHICKISNTMLLKLQIGGEIPKLSMLKESFDQAKISGQYRFFYPDSSVINWAKVVKRHENPCVLPPEYFPLLPVQDANELVKAFCSVLEELKAGDYDIDYAKQVIFEMMQTISSCITHVGSTGAEGLSGRFSESFAAMDSVDYLRDWVVDYVNTAYNKSPSAPAQEIIQKTKDYIETNLAGDLSLDAIADVVYMSPKYLSRMFKNVTGLNLSEYITQRRVDEACRLLKDTRLSVEDVAERVGYHSSAYFIKRFKEIKDCTPKQYRRSLIGG